MSGYQIIRDNILFLRQGIGLLEELNDEIYAKTVTPFFNSGTGKHIRHNLDHYEMFLAGLSTGSIDYDGRQRDPQIETDRRYAIQKMLSIISRLEGIETQRLDDPISVKMNEGEEVNDSSSRSQSTIRRELQFLLSHTVHHYALIAIILKLQGFDCDEDFGVAPSTLKYQRSVKN
ncbi:DinB family protein [candidate division KSB1 bacterium]|nr:DinB family protein [candidate division KSB1 bacterium]